MCNGTDIVFSLEENVESNGLICDCDIIFCNTFLDLDGIKKENLPETVVLSHSIGNDSYDNFIGSLENVYRTDYNGTITVSCYSDIVLFDCEYYYSLEDIEEYVGKEDAFYQKETGAGELVWICPGGTKYHNAGCKWLVEGAYEVQLDSLEKIGYMSCDECK